MDTLREWIGTLGTLAAFFWAVFLYWQSLNDRKMDQARLVSVVPLEPQVVDMGATIEMSARGANVGSSANFEYVPDSATDEYTGVYRATAQMQVRRIEVHNRSAEVVYAMSATMRDCSGGGGIGASAQTVYLRPGEQHTFTFFGDRNIEDWFSKDQEVQISVRFTDNVGQVWSKVVGGRTERVTDDMDPFGLMPPPAPQHRIWQLPFVRRFRK